MQVIYSLASKFKSVHFQNSEEKKGVFDRVSSFFRRKKSSSRQHSDASADASSPTSPQPKQEDGIKTPTSQKDSEPTGLNYESQTGADHSDTLSQSSSPSASSVVSLVTDDAEFPFADSNSSGRSSVREMNVRRVSTAGGERNSGNVTPTTLEPPTTTHLSADTSFSESVVEEVSKRLQVHLEDNILKNAESASEDRTVSPTAVTSFNTPLSICSPVEAPKSPNLTSISLGSKKTFVKVGEAGHITALTGVTLLSQSSASQLRKDGSLDIDKKNLKAKRNAQIFSGETTATAWSCSPEREEIPRSESPAQLHKAIWVETYLGEEEEEGEVVGEKENERMKQEEEDFRVDSPPVLAIPVTVIPVDDSATQGAADSPSTLSETLPSSGSLPESTISLAATTGEVQTTLPQPEEPDTGTDTKQSSLQGKHKLKEIRVTRKTVNLPSKHKVFAQKVYISPEEVLDGNEAAGEEYSTDSVLTNSDTTEVER